MIRAATSGMGHTPVPWSLCQHLKSVEDDAACKCGYRGVIFGPEHDVAMAICQPGHEKPRREEEWGSEPASYPRAVEIANMQFIVHAVNNHDALVEALRWALAELNGQTRYDEDDADQQIENCYRRAEAALQASASRDGGGDA